MLLSEVLFFLKQALINFTEEVEKKGKKLHDIVNEVADVIVARSEKNKNYGVVLVAEGLLEFVHEVNQLIKEINEIFSKIDEKPNEAEKAFNLVSNELSSETQKLFHFLPRLIAEQLLIDRDPHGNAIIGKIDTEKLLVIMLKTELDKRKAAGTFKREFFPITHFFGYEGRSAYPTIFDCDYCYSLGVNAAALVDSGHTGLMSVVRNLDKEPEDWAAGGCPLVPMMIVERRKGKDVPVIKKALVDLDGVLFKIYEKERAHWALGDYFQSPGPIQFEIKTRCPYIVKPPTAEELEHNENKVYKDSNRAFSRVYPTAKGSQLAYASSQIRPQLAHVLQKDNYEVVSGNQLRYFSTETKSLAQSGYPNLFKEFPTLNSFEIVSKPNTENPSGNALKLHSKSPKIGVVFCGKQFSGAHNVISGLLDFTERTKGELICFLGGANGLFEGKSIKLDNEYFEVNVAQDGLNYLGRTSDSIRMKQNFEKVHKTCESLALDGLVLVGGSNTYTDSVLVADFLLGQGSKTRVITIPGSADGNVGHNMIEANVGFDTSSKIYSQMIGNIMKDSASAIKLWYFLRLMGTDSSYLAIEAALQTQPNLVLVSEEVAQDGKEMHDVINDICDLVCERAAQVN